jgi:hypothetical protein
MIFPQITLRPSNFERAKASKASSQGIPIVTAAEALTRLRQRQSLLTVSA